MRRKCLYEGHICTLSDERRVNLPSCLSSTGDLTDSPFTRIDYATINPSQKWRMLRSQWRFGLWGKFSSVRRRRTRSPLLALWVSTGIIMQGFDITAGGQLAALLEFKKQFGNLQPSGSYLIPAIYLSAWNAIAPAVEIVSTFIFAPLLEKYGRKPGILVALIISVAGVLLQQLATDWQTHLAGRGVNGKSSISELRSGYLFVARNRNRNDVHYLAIVDWRDLSSRTAWLLPLLFQH